VQYLYIDNMENKEEILKKYYFQEKNPAAYAGPKKLLDSLNKKFPGVFTLPYIRQWLNDQDAYALQKPRRYRFKTRNVRVSAIGEQLDIDLLSMANLANENDGVRYLLCAIDILSRKLWVRVLKNKSAKVVLEAMQNIIQDILPTKIVKIRADKSSEFVNRWFRKYMQEQNIDLFFTNNPPKSNFVERVQRTLKERIYRFMRHKRTYRYIDSLEDIVSSYNATPHRGLKGLAPKDVNKSNESDVWARMYLKKTKKKNSKPKFQFKKGDLVRISIAKKPFQRAYQEQFTTEVFKVSSRILKQGIPMYKLSDLKGLPITGWIYANELLKVNKDENSLWFIERIVKKRKRNNKLQYYVRWLGFPPSFDSWVNESDVKDVADSGS